MNNSHKEREIKNVSKQLYNKMYTSVGELSAMAYITSEPVPFKDRKKGEKKRIEVSETWGRLWDCAWFNFTGIVPKEFNYEDLILYIDISGEGLVVDAKGNPVQGITTTLSTFDSTLGRPGKKYVQLSKVGVFEEKIDVWVDCGCNDLFGNYVDSGRLRKAELVVCNKRIHKLHFDMIYLQNLCTCIKDESYRLRIHAALYEESINLKDNQYSDEAVEHAIQTFAKFLSVPEKYKEDFMLSAIGHAHIDLAWLWPIRETKRKAARTLATALAMFEKYDDYIFGASQPQMFDWIKKEYESLYVRVKEAVENNRLECQGGMWVEADTNISGGEALIRQFLYGKKFFNEEFNKDMKILWLPDVFGYSAALPQIMKHAEIDYFMTIKLSWSEHNEFPYHTFLWRGIDGSEILSHMPPEGTYNSAAMPESLYKAVDNFKEKAISNQALLLFGIGDGGGGPGESHLEGLARAKTSVCVPAIKQQPAIEFFEEIVKDKEKYPRWTGELYLEKHQGTYTTHAGNKKYNRKMELLLRECEFACTLAARNVSFQYPKERIEAIWKEVLLYQFHDILPGSSIQRVYQESLDRYAILYEETTQIMNSAYEMLAANIKTDGNNVIVCFNSLPWERKEVITVSGKSKEVTIPPMGWATYDSTEFTEFVSNVSLLMQSENQNTYPRGEWILENDLVKAIFAEDGSIISYYDKEANREIIKEGERLNQYVLYNDEGDCWDIPFGYRDHAYEVPRLTEVKAYENTVEKGMIQTYQIGDSSMTVTITMKDHDKMLKFQMNVNWQESGKMLRAKFPLDMNANQAACEIQFGHIDRPTVRNTSWDLAKIEVPAHKWVDISENGYGVALINDCKYGHNLWDNTIELDILRSPSSPSEEEKGLHSLKYALYPHCGTLAESDVIKQGYFFNIPLQVIERSRESKKSLLTKEYSLLKPEKDNIIVEAVKKSEDETGYIIRLYESKGVKTTSNLCIPNAEKIMLSNALEKELKNIEIVDGNINLNFTAFEIKTIKVL